MDSYKVGTDLIFRSGIFGGSWRFLADSPNFEKLRLLEDRQRHNIRVVSDCRLDVSNLLHLHHNDFAALIVVSVKLKGIENYQIWSCAMLLALEVKNKTGFIDGSCRRSNTDEVLGNQWDRVNVVVYRWILNSISDELFLETLPDVRSAYATISSEESHRVTSCSISGTSQRCFKLIGYLANFGKKKAGQNFKRKNVSNNNTVRSNSSFGFTDEKLSTLSSLIKDNSLNENNVQANMDYVTEKAYTTSNVFQDLNHINFFDNEYLKIPYDAERVDPSLNSYYRSQSDSSHSSVPSEGVNIDGFPSGNNRNDAQSSNDTFASQNK
ncbi:ribonuclease H-like domain-containing protein [Tanacetum coccineum]